MQVELLRASAQRVDDLRQGPSSLIFSKEREDCHTSTEGSICTELCPNPQNPYTEALPPNVMIFGGGACGRLFSLEDVMRIGPL